MVCRYLKMLLCLLLAVMLPVCALADVQHTLKILPGAELGADSAVADLLNVLSLRLTKGSRSGALTIALEDEAIATAALTADATGLYVHSNLLSDDVLYVTWDDGFAYLSEMLKAYLRANGMPESELASLDGALTEVKHSIVAAIGSGMVSVPTSVPQVDAAVIEQVIQNDPDMQAYVDAMHEKFTVENGSFTAEGRDAADAKYTLTMDEEDLLKLCDTEYMRSLMREFAAVSDAQLQGDALEKAADELLEQVRELYRGSGYKMALELYTLSEGAELVGAELTMSMKLTVEDESHDLAMEAAYGRFTDESGVAYKADMDMQMNGSSAMQTAFELHRGVDEVSVGSFAVLAEGEEVTVQYRAENTKPDVRRRSIALYLRSGATAIIPPAFSDRPLLTFEVTTSPADPSVLAAVEKADAHNSVNVMKLSDEEMQALGTGITTRAMQALYSALAKLPTSSLKLAMQLLQ